MLASHRVALLRPPFRLLPALGARWKASKAGGEGAGAAPIRHPLAWNKEEFYDEKALDIEMRRVFDVCHGCRRCFNLCNSFPKLFELIDNSPSGELDSVPSSSFKGVVDDCTVCDLCFLTKCPYTPPHPLNVDFPHLMLRYRAVSQGAKNKEGAARLNPVPKGEDKVKMGPSAGGMSMEGHGDPARTTEGVSRGLVLEPPGWAEKELNKTDRNGKVLGAVAPIARWAMETSNPVTRPLMEAIAGVDKDAALPFFVSSSLTFSATHKPGSVRGGGGGEGKKVVLFATCLVNYNMPAIGDAASAVLRHSGVDVAVSYPGCCGMPQLEQGDVADVAEKVSKELLRHVDEGRTVVSLTPSCSLMLKGEWPLLLPEDEDIRRLSENTQDISEYVVSLRAEGRLSLEGMASLKGVKGVQLHHACHARAQNMGCKSAEMLRLIPDLTVTTVERCSGHGGSWGCKSKHHQTALKVGAPAARALLKLPKGVAGGEAVLSSECPLAAQHLMQLVGDITKKKGSEDPFAAHVHPVQLLAAAYGLKELQNVQ